MLEAGLKEDQFQAQLAQMAAEPPRPAFVFQDTHDDNVWDEFGGEHDDLFVYDRHGKLFAWLPADLAANLLVRKYYNTSGREGSPIYAPPYTADLMTKEGRATVRSVAILAALADPNRCRHGAVAPAVHLRRVSNPTFRSPPMPDSAPS